MKHSIISRKLHIESLENREMLNVSPLGSGEIAACSTASVNDTAVEEWGVGIPAGIDVWHLNSWASSSYTIYLDFNGFSSASTSSWGESNNWKNNFNPNYTDTQIYEIWNYVAQKYASFDVNVSTDVTLFDAPDNSRLRKTTGDTDGWGIRVVFGADIDVGGIAYVDSFTLTTDTPCYVAKQSSHFNAASVAVHEIGHTLGLHHDGLGDGKTGGSGYNGNYEYYRPQSGDIWGPIMGSPYSRIEQFSKGEYSSTGYTASNREDDLSIITTKNGFGYRPDHEITLNSTTNASGVIERSGDIDWLTFIADRTGTHTFSINSGYEIDGRICSSLYYQIALYDSAGSVVTSAYASLTSFTASISADLIQGQTYKLRVSGEGYGTVGVITNGCMGFTNYGSIGAYSIDIFGGYVTDKILPTPANFKVTGSISTVTVSWDAVPNRSSYTVEWSTSSDFSTITGSWTETAISFFKSDIPAGTYYFRVKTIGNGTNYSNSDWNVYGTAITVMSDDFAWLDDFLAAHRNLTGSIATWTDGRITSLSLNNCGLTGTLDVSALTALTYLDCSSNQLTSLDVSKNTALTTLNCSSNGMKQLYLPKKSCFDSILYSDGNPDIKVIVGSPKAVLAGKKDGTAQTSSVTAAFAVEDFNRIEKKNSNGKITTTATSYVIKVYVWNTNTKTFRAGKTFTVKSTAVNTVDGVLTYTLTGLKANTLYQITVQAKADARMVYDSGRKTTSNPKGAVKTLGEVRTWAVVPNASLKASTATENSVNVKVSNWGTSGGLWTQAVAKSVLVYTPIETDKATATVTKSISAVDTLLVTYKKNGIKQTVSLTWNGSSWIGNDAVSFNTETGIITIKDLSPSVKYTVQVQFSRSGEATAVKATSVSVSTRR